jgi:ornithine decarboxylase
MPKESYFEYDLSILENAYTNWYPNIQPYYAVKCNPRIEILTKLNSLGCTFDCASRNEIKQVLDIGVPKDDILYANPCKKPQDIKWAGEQGVNQTVIESISEINKLDQSGYVFDCFLRIRSDDPNAQCTLGNKYGAEEHEWEQLFKRLLLSHQNLVGVSFHVGSGSRNNDAHQNGINKSIECIERSRNFGFDPKIIDIGGGFRYGCLPPITLPEGYKIIGEPGRYFAEKVATLYTPVIGVSDDSLTIDESLYGSFNCIMYDHAHPTPTITGDKEYTIFGCTCDGIDVIGKYMLPPLSIGDVIEWKNMGAYTNAATTSFNGMTFSSTILIKH